MRFSEAQVLLRQPVWEALSWLYLDNDDQPYAAAAQVCAESPFGLEELEKIIFEEVHPHLKANLLPAGMIHGGFDQDWLKEKIQSARPALVLGASAYSRWARQWLWPWRAIRKDIVRRRAKLGR